MDDDQLIRVSVLVDRGALQSSLEAVLEQASGMKIVASGENAEVVVLDGSIPGPTQLDSIQSVRRRNEASRVVLLSVHDDPVHVGRALEAGADGYVLADWAGRDLISAVQAVRLGQPYLSPRLRWADEEDGDGKDRHAPAALAMHLCGE
jgi:DNA-binding NarL/FixJ family response regulator